MITYSCYLARVFSKLGFATRQNMRTYCAEIEKLSIFLMIICIKYMYKSYLCLLYFYRLNYYLYENINFEQNLTAKRTRVVENKDINVHVHAIVY